MPDNNLKVMLDDIHKEAESHDFVSVLMSGKINPDLYGLYLWSQMKRYQVLEDYCDELGVFDDFPELKRHDRIKADFKEMLKLTGQKRAPNFIPQSVVDYMKTLKAIFEDEEEDSMQLFAHVYTLHMGDLSGGQMIKPNVPGSGTMYDFDTDVEELKSKVREKLSDDMEPQARACFVDSIKLFDDLMASGIEPYKS